ncbi:MAG: hypothetical protein U0165_08675 [Polyangiaceae bacterium]
MNHRGIFVFAMAFVAFVSANGCSSDSDSGGSVSCQDLSGSWTLSGTCNAISREVKTSSSCTMTATCNDGTTLSGSGNGKTFTLSSGTTSCSGSVKDTSGSLSCSTSAEAAMLHLRDRQQRPNHDRALQVEFLTLFATSAQRAERSESFSGKSFVILCQRNGSFNTSACVANGHVDLLTT